MVPAKLSTKLRHVAGCWRPLQDARSMLGLPANKAAACVLPTKDGGTTVSNNSRIKVLTGIRALALMWVLAFHVAFIGSAGDLVYPDDKSMPQAPDLSATWINSWLAQPILNGDLGVDVFFALSGMLIATMWLRETVKRKGHFNFLRFMARRYLRLAPMLGIGILSQLLSGYVSGHFQMKLHACTQEWWKILLMINNYIGTDTCLTQSWSVAVEFQLYLLAPLVLYAAWDPWAHRPRKLWGLTLFGFWLVAPVIRLVVALLTAPSSSNIGSNFWISFNMWGLSHLPLTYKAVFTRCAPFVAGIAAALALEWAKQHRAAGATGTDEEAAAAKAAAPSAAETSSKEKTQQVPAALLIKQKNKDSSQLGRVPMGPRMTAASSDTTDKDSDQADIAVSIYSSGANACNTSSSGNSSSGSSSTAKGCTSSSAVVVPAGELQPGQSLAACDTTTSDTTGCCQIVSQQVLAPAPPLPKQQAAGSQEISAATFMQLSSSESAATAVTASAGSSSHSVLNNTRHCSCCLFQQGRSSSHGRLWHAPHWALHCLDVIALALAIFFVFVGGGENRHTFSISPALDDVIIILGRSVFGAVLAWLLAAALRGRCHAIAWVLSLDVLVPAAFLSYPAYLLQDVPLALVLSWTAAGVTTLFAGWAVYFFEFVYFTLLCLAISVPFHLLVEMPFQRVIKRGY